MKKHFYYLLVSEDAQHTECMIVKAYNMGDIKRHALNVKNIRGRYDHYNDAKAVATPLASTDLGSGEPMIKYTSLTGVDFVD